MMFDRSHTLVVARSLTQETALQSRNRAKLPDNLLVDTPSDKVVEERIPCY